jgi:hypothetical protein
MFFKNEMHTTAREEKINSNEKHEDTENDVDKEQKIYRNSNKRKRQRRRRTNRRQQRQQQRQTTSAKTAKTVKGSGKPRSRTELLLPNRDLEQPCHVEEACLSEVL